MRLATVFVMLAMLVGCSSYPVEQLKTGDQRPAILVEGAPRDAVLLVDELSLGPVSDPSGTPQAILVESGTHTVRVTANGVTLLSDRIFVSGAETKTISVGKPPQ